jgi:hypothetical protein
MKSEKLPICQVFRTVQLVKESSGNGIPIEIEADTVPVTINGNITLNFIIDSGASDVAVPAGVVSTLIRNDLQARANRRKKLESSARPQPVAESHSRCKVQRRNRGRQIASSSRCRLTPVVTKIQR